MTSKKVSLKVLYVIPVRSGSKGLPGKNIKKLNGHPLVAILFLQLGLAMRVIVL